MNKLMAEALVECGYASGITIMLDRLAIIVDEPLGFHKEIVDPCYAKGNIEFECYARRQADALEDWLNDKDYHLYEPYLWQESVKSIPHPNRKTKHQTRLDRIKWCFEQLEKDDE